MEDIKKVVVEFSQREADILCRALQVYNPPSNDEMIVTMIYARITTATMKARRES